MRRFAKSVTGETWFAGSNPVLSASRKPLPTGEGFFVELFQVAMPQAAKSSGISRRGQTNLQKHRFFAQGANILPRGQEKTGGQGPEVRGQKTCGWPL
jgi:hypothetical protein